jgi:hypothetical protein
MLLTSLEEEMKVVTTVARSLILHNFGPRLHTININYLPGLSLEQFGILCMINDELHCLLEEMWLLRIGTHYNIFKLCMIDIKNNSRSCFHELFYDVDESYL